ESKDSLNLYSTLYRFTGKELDEETGLYYYGARYLDPKTSRWISSDPALGDYIPLAPVSDEARKHNRSLPGMGGVYNLVNLQLYHYAGNNPVKYIDPDGREQNVFQSIFTSVLQGLSNIPLLGDSIRSGITIDIQRSEEDNGNNGKYYRSELNIKFLAMSLNKVAVQSTADHPRLGQPGYEGRTLPEGEYTGYLLKSSGSYLNPIHLVNEELEVTIDDDYLIHPNQFTRRTGGPWNQPYGLGCQITKLEGFNEITNILKGMGFEYKGDLTDRSPKKRGDTIPVKIRGIE
ncbi:RHS repeat-associated core domain-containing protein, partial [Spirochaetia bacterium 38H-sp]